MIPCSVFSFSLFFSVRSVLVASAPCIVTVMNVDVLSIGCYHGYTRLAASYLPLYGLWPFLFYQQSYK